MRVYTEINHPEKVLIVSDTHANNEFLGRVLLDHQDCQSIIHLGDEPDDLDCFEELLEKKNIFFIYGIYHPLWKRSNSCISFMINDLNFVIAHALQHLHFVAMKSIYCFGHTHHKYFEQTEDKVLINPGHLKKSIDRGEPAGYVVLEISDVVKVLSYQYPNQIIEEYNINFRKNYY